MKAILYIQPLTIPLSDKTLIWIFVLLWVAGITITIFMFRRLRKQIKRLKEEVKKG